MQQSAVPEIVALKSNPIRGFQLQLRTTVGLNTLNTLKESLSAWQRTSDTGPSQHPLVHSKAIQPPQLLAPWSALGSAWFN